MMSDYFKNINEINFEGESIIANIVRHKLIKRTQL
jgi:hypothetical protein